MDNISKLIIYKRHTLKNLTKLYFVCHEKSKGIIVWVRGKSCKNITRWKNQWRDYWKHGKFHETYSTSDKNSKSNPKLLFAWNKALTWFFDFLFWFCYAVNRRVEVFFCAVLSVRKFTTIIVYYFFFISWFLSALGNYKLFFIPYYDIFLFCEWKSC